MQLCSGREGLSSAARDGSAIRIGECSNCNEILEIAPYEISGDHGDKLTIYNVRGLACTRCNWHLGMYEADARGDCRGWEDAYIYISERDFEPYAYAYECRILA